MSSEFFKALSITSLRLYFFITLTAPGQCRWWIYQTRSTVSALATRDKTCIYYSGICQFCFNNLWKKIPIWMFTLLNFIYLLLVLKKKIQYIYFNSGCLSKKARLVYVLTIHLNSNNWRCVIIMRIQLSLSANTWPPKNKTNAWLQERMCTDLWSFLTATYWPGIYRIALSVFFFLSLLDCHWQLYTKPNSFILINIY